MIHLDTPHSTVSVPWPETYTKYLKSKLLNLNLKLGLFKHWLLQSETLSDIPLQIILYISVKWIPRGFQMAEEVLITCKQKRVGFCNAACAALITTFQWQKSRDNCLNKHFHSKEKPPRCFKDDLLHVKGHKWKIRIPGVFTFCDAWEHWVSGTT